VAGYAEHRIGAEPGSQRAVGQGEKTWRSPSSQSQALPVKPARISVAGQGIRTRRKKWRTWKFSRTNPHGSAIHPPHTHKANLLRYFDLTDDAATDVVREVGGVTDAKGVRT
jgi:sarcosine oxidase delta subunit